MVMINEDSLIIKDMREEDLHEVLEIEKASFSDPWSYDMFYAELFNPLSHLWVARDVSEKLIGYLCFWLVEDESHLLNLAVHQLYRRRGVASELLADCLDCWRKSGIKNVYLEVRESNKAACRLYEKFGFSIMMRRPGYYKNPVEDAYVMALEI
jgi:ribosomal-protein-alanine N-acetyltransferase